ncbi:hypothetical protein GNIT_1169 [Glaciecola nitratireducens FR1064]|uniref:Uncharacterized protein n=1 Tax=Glaciecola nitratireducens (strain JCM 12485 / KCTC 12276 / FR1064) TaxID=1085623 RepID=G4QK97_GLANF|nr:hypothetical protein GNIT_1169 [Glaciecola nitratireducens FR1064]
MLHLLALNQYKELFCYGYCELLREFHIAITLLLAKTC